VLALTLNTSTNKNMLRKNKSLKGFSLVELSVSLAIIGMIAGSAISVAVTSDSYTKKAETNSKLDRIEEALAGFLQSNLRLPCVANGTLPSSDPQYGIEGTMTPAAGGLQCPNKNFSGAFINEGVVPMRTLQLPDDYMFDGWGRRITYVVDYRMANNPTTNTTCDGVTSTVCFIDGNGSIVVNDASGTARAGTAVYLLLSHGENAHGAYTKNGSATRINAFPAGNPYRSGSAAELANSHFDNSGANTAYNGIFVQKDPVRIDDTTLAAGSREYFDDIIRFKAKVYLVKAAGKVRYDGRCRDAAAIVNSPGTNNCTGAANEANCESMATEVYLRCLN
jgi:prepilin-type N-terminal cleavage/methylation domain-containing protein